MKTKPSDVRHRNHGGGGGAGTAQFPSSSNNNNKNDGRVHVVGCVMTDQEIEALPLYNKNDCLKSVKELNREIAHYCHLLVGVGGIHDSDILRNELKKSRRRALELAKLNRLKLLPHLRGKMCQKDELEEFEKLWTTFASSLELVLIQIRRTLSLHKLFMLHSQNTVLVNTGLVDALPPSHSKRGCSSSSSHQPVDGPSTDHSVLERQEISLLESEYCDMNSMLVEIHQAVDIKPWAIEPVIQVDTLDCSKSLNSASEVSTVDEVSVYNQERHKRRKCICIISVILFSVVVFATVLGVCIALYT